MHALGYTLVRVHFMQIGDGIGARWKPNWDQDKFIADDVHTHGHSTAMHHDLLTRLGLDEPRLLP